MRLIAGAEHFRVDEIPAYAPTGSGEHLYLHLRKTGIATDAVATVIAKACGVRSMDVGFAGRKDRHGITSQWFSVYRGQEAQVADLAARFQPGQVEVLAVSRHANKLRLGHLSGNAFQLGLEGVADAGALQQAADRLAHDGIPNRYGTQRFGVNQATLHVAKAWAAGDAESAVAWIVDPSGAWQPGQPLPEGFRPGYEGRILGALRHGATAAKALAQADPSYRKLVASAAQSALFNAVLDGRIAAGDLHRLHPGDIAVNAKGAPFIVAAADADDCTRRAQPGVLDVRATGPLPGTSRMQPEAARLAQEQAWTAATGIDWAWFASGPLESPGERRPLVVPFLQPPVVTGDGSGVRFALPSGSYATEVLGALGIAVPEDRRG